MRLPDWLVYLLMLIGVVSAIYAVPMFWESQQAEQPNSKLASDLEIEATVGRDLPPPSLLGDTIKIQVEAPQNGTGTAFAINRRGDWLTARHVVEGCDEVYIYPTPGIEEPVRRVIVDQNFDLALLSTDLSTTPLSLNLSDDLKVGGAGYHTGYPQARPGEVRARLHSQTLFFTFGERQGEEPVLIWIEQGRTNGLNGELGGISGGPVFDRDGNVMSVSLAYSSRLGRLYSSTPGSIEAFLIAAGVPYNGSSGENKITPSTYTEFADAARAKQQITKLICVVEENKSE